MSELKFLSLYDYLGKAAGKTLGGEVLKEAQSKSIIRKTKHVTQGGYDGLVMMYPKQFLDWYFTEKFKNA
jgi:hypothetical protein